MKPVINQSVNQSIGKSPIAQPIASLACIFAYTYGIKPRKRFVRSSIVEEGNDHNKLLNYYIILAVRSCTKHSWSPHQIHCQCLHRVFCPGECLTNNGGCSHFCFTTETSRTCDCALGFFLSQDARNCYTSKFLRNMCVSTKHGPAVTLFSICKWKKIFKYVE